MSPHQDEPDSIELSLAAEIVKELKRTLVESYEEAGISGLCDEGRFEAALGALESLPLDELIQRARNNQSR